MGAGAPGAAPWRSGPPRPPAPPCGGRRGIGGMRAPCPPPVAVRPAPAVRAFRAVSGAALPACRSRSRLAAARAAAGSGPGPRCGAVLGSLGLSARGPARHRRPGGPPGVVPLRRAACPGRGGRASPRPAVPAAGVVGPGLRALRASSGRPCASAPVARAPSAAPLGPPSRALPGGPASPWAAAGSSRRRGAAALQAARMRPAPAAFGGLRIW